MVIHSKCSISLWKPSRYIFICIVIELTINSVFGLTFHEKFYPDTLRDQVFLPEIKTVLLHSATWELASPVIEAGSEQHLELHFDDLSAIRHSFGYTLIHCDAGWKPSNLSPQEYLSGFGLGEIRESYASLNTTYDYIHYQLTFPGDECMPLFSGNYAIVVFDNDDPARIILTRRFYVTENAIQISARLSQPSLGEFRENGQQIEFSLDYDRSSIRDPLNDLTIMIKQNDRDDNALSVGKPLFTPSGLLEYSNLSECIFQGGNEFRNLDIKSMKYQTENIALIDFQNPYYHVFLKTDEPRWNKSYFSRNDLNGGFFIDQEKSNDKHTEADYVFVHFCLAVPLLYAVEKVYITGGFCDWTLAENNKMVYNTHRNYFEAILLLKQGFYDYCYAIGDPQKGEINSTLFEGSYFETGNEYAVFVYYHDRQGRYDRLIGYLPLK